MKAISSRTAAVALLASLPAFAQEPTVGVADPESLFVDEDPLLNRNKQATLHILRELVQCNQWDRAREWLTDRYLQHNPNATSGIEGVIHYFTEVMKLERVEPCGELTMEIIAVMADDDYVTVIWPWEFPDPRRPGKTYRTTGFDTWRFVDGKADEHWDPSQLDAPSED
jgi:predicted SnoaL-like aldol condensation-catalyzing enzyme